MSLDAAWAVGQDALFATMGVPAVVKRPAPDDTPIETMAVWLPSSTETMPTGADYQRREAVRVLALSRADVPTTPRNTTIVAAERSGQTARTWRVDGTDRADVDHVRVIVIPVAE